MKVGWLHRDPGYLGGAELTMAEFAKAAPADVELIHNEPDADCDEWVIGNWRGERPDGIRYVHDMGGGFTERDCLIFCSPLQRDHYMADGYVIPPAVDLTPFEAVANGNHRAGAVCIGRMAYGKGLQRLAEYEEPVDVYSSVPVTSEGNARYQGPAVDVAETLARYQRFVFAPDALEPFGRAVVEAWAAGLELHVNRNVGALHFIRNDQDALRTAARDFWEVVQS